MMANSTHTAYTAQEIQGASPEKCVLFLYDAAIQGCAQNQQDRTRRALTTLMDALDFETGGDLAQGLFRLYEYCLKMVHRSQYDGPMQILKGLRETWHMAMDQQSTRQ